MHNLAVVFWIVANCTWMVGEFYGWDEGTFGLRNMALLPFSIGLIILAVYYGLYFSKRSIREKVILQTEEALKEEIGQNTDRKTA